MDHFLHLFSMGGPFMYLVLLVAGAGLILAFTCGGLTAARVRMPAPAWLVALALLPAVGALGRFLGQRMADKAVGSASFEQKDALLAAGLSIAAYTEVFAWSAVALLAALTALSAGLFHMVGAGRPTRFTPVPGFVGGGLALLVATALLVWAVLLDGGGYPYLGPACLLFGGVGALLVGLRTGVEEADARQMAAARALVGFCLVLAPLAALLAGRLDGFILINKAVGAASAEQRMALVALGVEVARASTWTGLAATMVGLVAAAALALPTAGKLMNNRTLLMGLVSASLMFPAVAICSLTWLHADRLVGQLSMFHGLTVAEQVVDLPEDNSSQSGTGVQRVRTSYARVDGAWIEMAAPGRDEASPWDTPDTEGHVLVAASGAEPVRTLVERRWFGADEDGDRYPIVEVMVRNSYAFQATDHRYVQAMALRGVWFLWLTGDGADIGSTGTGGASGGAESEFDEDERADAPPSLARVDLELEDVLYVVDVAGGAAAGASADLGLTAGASETWALSSHGHATALGNAADAREELGPLVRRLQSRAVVFVPGSSWSVQELVDLCAAAQIEQEEDGSSYSWSAFRAACAVDDSVPTASYGDYTPARLLGTEAVEAARAERLAAESRRSGYGSGYSSQTSGGTPGMATGDPIVLGAVDRSAIEKEIKKHLAQIRYCYQKELNKNPALYGKIVIKFVIAKDGSVSSAKVNTTTMNNPIVENCICQRFMRFQFPEPRGGGIAIVSYPFVFKSG